MSKKRLHLWAVVQADDVVADINDNPRVFFTRDGARDFVKKNAKYGAFGIRKLAILHWVKG